jgi:hypothetical protein
MVTHFKWNVSKDFLANVFFSSELPGHEADLNFSVIFGPPLSSKDLFLSYGSLGRSFPKKSMLFTMHVRKQVCMRAHTT